MDEDDVRRLLGSAFDARARQSVPDDAAPPPPRFAGPGAGADAHVHRRRVVRWLAPVAAAAAVVAVVVAVPALTGDDSRGRPNNAAGTSAPAVHTSVPAPADEAVRVSLGNPSGRVYGVGMPVVAYFSQRFTNARAFAHATSVTVNGKPMPGAWYFERSPKGPGPIEGHFRLRTYWPARAKVHVAVAARGLPAGTGLHFANDFAFDFATGPQTLATVDAARHLLTVTTDGKPIGEYPVSLGTQQTPTASGVKVIMQKGSPVCMSGPGYRECGVQYTQRLTDTGEFLHAAPWNTANIKAGVDSSNGCTNLLKGDARRLYGELQVGDPVLYPNATGPPMTMSEGYGDWDVPWKVWRTGGLVPTH